MVASAKLVSVVAGFAVSAWGAVALGAGQAVQCFLTELVAHLPH